MRESKELPASTSPLVEGVTPFKLEKTIWVENIELQRLLIRDAFPHLSEEEVDDVLRKYGY